MSDGAGRSPRIVLVDDNPDDRRLTELAIRRELPTIETIEVTDEASFKAALDGDFDLVITDYHLRWSDGLRVLRSVKEKWPDRPVVMFTGSGSEEIAVEAMRLGLDDYVLKGPRRAARLPAAVRSAIRRSEERQALAASQARYRELFDSVPIGLYRTTEDGRVLDSNVAMAQMLGFADADAFATQPWNELWVDPADWEAWHEAIERDGVVRGFETRLRGADGSIHWLVVEARGVRDDDGRVRWHEGSAVDLTDRRLAEDALRASEARKGAMLEAAIDGVIGMDATGRITEFSPAAERTFGYRRDDVIGKRLAEVLVPPDLRERHRTGLARYLATGEASILGRRLELRALRADGRQIPVEVAINRIDVPGPPAFTGYVRDISAQRRLEESLRQAQRMDAIGQLAGGVAHDFNNMLTVIDGFSALLLDDLDEGDLRRELVMEIQRATARASSLTAQLLSVSRRQVLHLQPVDLNRLVAHLLPLLRRVVPEDVVTNVHTAAEPVVVDIDDAHFEQVMLNLAVNARDAMVSGGTLTIETAIVELDAAFAEGRPGVRPGRHAMLAVGDTGIGMDAATLARIFEPFFTTKDIGKGTGLGLAMVYGTVQQSGGHIWVQSEPGHGTTVRIYLPLSGAKPAEPEALAEHGPRRLGRGVTVLVAEDEDQVRELMVRALEKAGCTVITASDGAEALSAVDTGQRLDLAVADVIMPGGNGPEVVRLLRRTRPHLRALFVSGYAPKFGTSRGIPLEGEPHFLQKPFTLSQFIDAVGKVLEAPEVADDDAAPETGAPPPPD
jgi:PAS domain S-box-containing protein